jgi:serine/threonine protein kinase
LHLLPNVFILLQRLTGHHLFSDKTASDILIKNKKCDFPPSFLNRLSDKCIHLFYLEKDLFLKMTEVKPSHRITPEAALKHTYFDEDIDDCDEIPEE